MTVTVHYAFRWTQRDGTVCGIQAAGADTTDKEAMRKAWFDALQSALLSGWTEPKWWHWWRKNDAPRTCKPPPELI